MIFFQITELRQKDTEGSISYLNDECKVCIEKLIALEYVENHAWSPAQKENYDDRH